MTDQEKIRAAAFRQLRNAGFIHDDPDMVGLFDLSAVKVIHGNAIVPRAVTDSARAARPEMFSKSALDMTAAEVESGLRKLASEDAGRRVKAANDRAMADLRKKFGVD